MLCSCANTLFCATKQAILPEAKNHLRMYAFILKPGDYVKDII